jgi:hypothetical protein
MEPLDSELSSPTATQSEGDAHETPSRVKIPAGTVWTAQVPPPSVVATATPVLAPGPVSSPPTATQSMVVAHETAARSVFAPGTAWTAQTLPPSEVVMTAPEVWP